VSAATQQRKDEHAEYVRALSINSAAKELLGVAQTRLNKFYNPRLYKQTLTTTPAPDDFSFLQESSGKSEVMRAKVQLHQQPSSPETWGAYQKKSGKNVGVLEMLASLIGDLQKETEEAKIEEEYAQKDYEKTMSDSAAKRAEDFKYIATQESAVADEEASKSTKEQNQRKQIKILEEQQKFITATHADCDFLVQNFDLRKQARADEMEAMGKAQTILAGADFSFVQDSKLSHATRHLRGH